MRRKLIAGNWKMNKTLSDAVKFSKDLANEINVTDRDVVVCVPAVSLVCVAETLKDTNIKVGAQTMHEADEGEFTGEISAPMLEGMDIKYVIIGHSERRKYYNEADAKVNEKVKKAIEKGITPIICVGEEDYQRNWNVTDELIRMQTKIALSGVSCSDAAKVVIAYEPIWAIGKGKTPATAEQAESACAAIRKVVEELCGANVSEQIRILYGGSVKPANAGELFRMPNIDGGLVGGASLTMDFVKIVNYDL